MEDIDVKNPEFILRLSGELFQNQLSCLGNQLARILTCIKNDTSHLTWYVFDVFGSGNQPTDLLFPKPYSEIKDTEELIKLVGEIVQFHSGVFIAIKKGKTVNWDLNLLPETEESEGLQHPDAEFEIRAFDMSYFEIYGMDIKIERQILSCFSI